MSFEKGDDELNLASPFDDLAKSSSNIFFFTEEKSPHFFKKKSEFLHKEPTFNRFGHVIVDDHRDVLDINTTTSDVGGHQDILGSILETGQSKLSLLLSFTTV